MTLSTGGHAPIHKRHNEREANEAVCRRYKELRLQIPEQVALLQADAEFCAKCADLYARGYKDWVILNVIYNCMVNWRIQRTPGSTLRVPTPGDWQHAVEHVRGTTYRAWRFVEEDFDFHIGIHNVACLTTYGFEMRRSDFKPGAVERFLRERMLHFDHDLPHEPMFGTPPGSWPVV